MLWVFLYCSFKRIIQLHVAPFVIFCISDLPSVWIYLDRNWTFVKGKLWGLTEFPTKQHSALHNIACRGLHFCGATALLQFSTLNWRSLLICCLSRRTNVKMFGTWFWCASFPRAHLALHDPDPELGSHELALLILELGALGCYPAGICRSAAQLLLVLLSQHSGSMLQQRAAQAQVSPHQGSLCALLHPAELCLSLLDTVMHWEVFRQFSWVWFSVLGFKYSVSGRINLVRMDNCLQKVQV